MIINNTLNKISRNPYVFLAQPAFLFLFILSVVFYKERVVFIDTVFQFFKIVNFEKFNIEAGRYSTFITQIPLLLALKSGLNLKLLTLIFSLSFVLAYYGIFLLCTYFFKNPAAGLSIVIILILCVRQSFFHPTTETRQALVYSVLLFAVLQYNYKPKWILLKYVLGIVTISLCFYAHPVALFTVVFVIAYHMIDRSGWKEKGVYILFLLILALSLIKYMNTDKASYEGTIFSQLMNVRQGQLSIFHFYSLRFFISRFFVLYFWGTIVFIILTGFYIWNRMYIKAGFFVLFVAGFFLVTIFTYKNGDSDVMMERAFMPLALIVILPFMNEFSVIRNKKSFIALGLVIIIMFSGFRRLLGEGKNFKSRLAYMTELLNMTRQYEGRKFLISKSEINMEKIVIPWSFPFTTLVVSSMEGRQHSTTIFLYDDPAPYEKYILDKETVFLGADFWLEWDTSNMNKKYFDLPQESYVIMEISKY